ncbi:response regulator transcription factor [Catenulispora sp. NF23]|uniref:Response regulator transcription factor n=1 Tax=Catenulispora pinistramenti TaxID=2705254 RepID=A0ABS5KRJ3_9ACTN|nr:response regulator transcription factor [Catenulispora pinistramenti]MBS2536881.1 response regulator transcription factor [Catenulispora pinistramenti]MBS2548671.1 response regulator transcription factor [Catenulispora pinistramenti]
MLSGCLRLLLTQAEDFTVVGEGAGDVILDAARELRPDVTVVVSPALTINDVHELGALAEVTKVVLAAKGENAHRAVEAMRRGVHAILSQDGSAENLLQVLRMVVISDVMVMPAAAAIELRHEPRPWHSDTSQRLAAKLSARQAETMLLLAQGCSNLQIAEKLAVSDATVRSHVHQLLGRLGVRTRAQAVAVAYETGLIALLGEDSAMRT